MKMQVISLIALIFLAFGYSFFNEPIDPEITKEEIVQHISYLASDELKGRFSGSDGAAAAAEYIKKEFESSKIKPFFGNDYYQEFDFVAGLELTDNNKVSIGFSKESIKPEIGKDYTVLYFSDSGTASGELVFAGYGISAPELEYDDYKDIDVTGKIVLVMRYNPDIDNPHSKFDKYSELRYKAKTAKDKGAAGMILFNGYIPKDEDDKLVKLNYDNAPAMKSFPAVQIKRIIAEKLFTARNTNLSDLQKKMNDEKKPSSFLFTDVKVDLETGIKQVNKSGINVAGFIEGNDPELKNEYIVIGAHYDHIGMGETGSLYRGEDQQIHNGADDNASGTTGVIELAEKFAGSKDKLKRSVIFVAFSGEELGLLGSNYFVQNLSVPPKQIIAMINMDMIGRMNAENNLIVYGTGTSPVWKDLLNKNNEFSFKLSFNDEGYGPSDQSSFYAKEIPVLFFFTGTHSDYHRPSDDVDKINAAKEEQILKYIYSVTEDINTNSTRPEYVNVPRKDTGGAMRFKVYVGTIPDYGSQAEGFKITGVSEGSPAQKAGLKGGDIIVEFGGKKVSNIYDYMYAMNSFAPGDIVDVLVKRDKDELKLKLELAAK